MVEPQPAACSPQLNRADEIRWQPEDKTESELIPMAVAWEDERNFIAGKALCDDGIGGLTDLFFSEEIPDIIEAKAICGMCENRSACLDGALARHEPWGVWGGELFVSGKVLAKKRPRGRPPKDPARRLTA